MSNQCDCGDPDCSVCGGRPRASKTPVLDAFMQQKAQEDAARKAAAKAPAVAAPAPTVVQVETPPVAQLAQGWAPPAHLQEETQRLLSLPAEQFAMPTPAPGTQQPAKPVKQKTPFQLAYAAWQAECLRRKEWIAAKKEDWRKAAHDRDVALIQWNNHVLQAKRVYEQALATEPPPAPRKETFAAQ